MHVVAAVGLVRTRERANLPRTREMGACRGHAVTCGAFCWLVFAHGRRRWECTEYVELVSVRLTMVQKEGTAIFAKMAWQPALVRAVRMLVVIFGQFLKKCTVLKRRPCAGRL